MLAYNITLVPTNTTQSFFGTTTSSGSARNVVPDFATSTGSARGSFREESFAGERSTTASGFQSFTERGQLTFDGDVYDPNTASGSTSGATTLSWDGKFTIRNENNGDLTENVGTPLLGNVASYSTSAEELIVQNVKTTNTTTTARSGTVATIPQQGTNPSYTALTTTATETTSMTTDVGGEATRTRKQTYFDQIVEIVGYSVDGFTHEKQAEFATVVVPEDNEIIWVLTGEADGVLQNVGYSTTGTITLYPEKEFYQKIVVGTGFDNGASEGNSQTTFYESTISGIKKTVAPYRRILPPEEEEKNVSSITDISNIGFYFTGTNIIPAPNITTTFFNSYELNAAGSNWREGIKSTRTTKYLTNAYIVTNSGEDDYDFQGESGGFDVTEESASQFSNQAAGNWSKNKQHYFTKIVNQHKAFKKSFLDGWFVLSESENYASFLEAEGITVSVPQKVLANISVVGVYPTTWSYVSGEIEKTSITASAWLDKISLTKINENNIVDTETASFKTRGEAITNIKIIENDSVLFGGNQVLGGVSAIFPPATYSTFNQDGEGTSFLSGVKVLNNSESMGAARISNFLFGGDDRVTSVAKFYSALPPEGK